METARSHQGSQRKWLFNVAVGCGVLLVCLLLVGATYQWIAQSADAHHFPQQGRSVALGPSFPGLSLNVYCTGQGSSPTVILESGLGWPAAFWSLVQPEVAKFTRVCSYDRAGYGWSSEASKPLTSLQMARELHALLVAAGETGPYVLVGHSTGAFIVRLYNHEYPSEVAGMVLVDASDEAQANRMAPVLRSIMKVDEEWQGTEAVVRVLLMHVGVLRFLSSTNGRWGIPESLSKELDYLMLQQKAIESKAFQAGVLFPEDTGEVRAAGNLGGKPLVVLTRGKNLVSSWNDLQVQQTHLSSRGRQIIVSDSDTMIPFERPDAVVSAVREVCVAANPSASTRL